MYYKTDFEFWSGAKCKFRGRKVERQSPVGFAQSLLAQTSAADRAMREWVRVLVPAPKKQKDRVTRVCARFVRAGDGKLNDKARWALPRVC